MTTNPLNNVTTSTGYTVGTVLNANGTPSAKTTSSGLGQDDFLKLLVAELKNQSPDKPADTTAMMTQEAQFSQLNAMLAVQKSSETLLNSMQSTQAAGMIGKNIQALASDGASTITGKVTGVKLGTDGPTLLVGNMEVSLGSVTEVDAGS